MKKNVKVKKEFLLLFCAVILMTSCSENETLLTLESDLNQIENHDIGRYTISEGEAAKIGADFIQSMSDKHVNPSQNGSKIRRVASDSNQYDNNDVSQISGCYVINYPNNQGFAVVSADKRDYGTVYLASENGNFDFSNQDNPLFDIVQLAIECQDYRINQWDNSQSAMRGGDKEDDWIIVEDTVWYNRINPLLNTYWHQGSPFNAANSDSVVGCVPIAIGQIMAYHQYPSSSYVSTPYSATPFYYVYDWTCLSNIHTGYEATTNYEISQISNFIQSIRYQLGMYLPTTNGSNINTANAALTQFGYATNGVQNYSLNSTVSSLNNNRPVLMCGKRDKNHGHAWVLDGYLFYKLEHRTYDAYGNPVPDTILNEYNWDETYDYLHLNIGGGVSGAFYQNVSHSFQSASTYGAWANGSLFTFNGHSYTLEKKIICNIHPSN